MNALNKYYYKLIIFFLNVYLFIYCLYSADSQEINELVKSLNTHYIFLWDLKFLTPNELESFAQEKKMLCENKFEKVPLNGVLNQVAERAKDKGIFNIIDKLSLLDTEKSSIDLYNDHNPTYEHVLATLLSLSYLYKFSLYKYAESGKWEDFSHFFCTWTKALSKFKGTFPFIERSGIAIFLSNSKYDIPIKNIEQMDNVISDMDILYLATSGMDYKKQSKNRSLLLKKFLIIKADLLAHYIWLYKKKFGKLPKSLNDLYLLFKTILVIEDKKILVEYSVNERFFTLSIAGPEKNLITKKYKETEGGQDIEGREDN